MKNQSSFVIWTLVRKGRFQIDEDNIARRKERRDFSEWQGRIVAGENFTPHSSRQHHIACENQPVVRKCNPLRDSFALGWLAGAKRENYKKSSSGAHLQLGCRGGVEKPDRVRVTARNLAREDHWILRPCDNASYSFCLVRAGHLQNRLLGRQQHTGKKRHPVHLHLFHPDMGRNPVAVSNQRLARKQAGCVRIWPHAPMQYVEFRQMSRRQRKESPNVLYVFLRRRVRFEFIMNAMNIL